MKKLIIVVSVMVLVGCATPPLDLSKTEHKIVFVPAKEIVVEDFTRVQKYNATDAVWSGGFHPLPDTVTTPPYQKLVLENLRASLRGDNKNTSDVLNIAVLEASIDMESHVADSVVFVGIASAFSNRRYMCVADINFRYKEKTSRKKFDVTYMKNRGWGDIPTSEKGEMVSNCINQLVEDIAGFASSVIKAAN